MQTSGEKLTIAEFAARAGCTPQRVSQLLRKSLKEFQIIENGRKYILSDGLQVVLDAREKQGYRKSFETVSETLSNPCGDDPTGTKTGSLNDAAAIAALQGVISDHEEETERLRAALDEERRKREAAELVNARLTAERDAERHRVHDVAAERDRLAEIVKQMTTALQAEQAHAATLATALTQQQALNAGQIRLAMLDSDGSGKPAEDQTEPTKSAAGQSETVQQERKKGFLSRIFKRRKSTK